MLLVERSKASAHVSKIKKYGKKKNIFLQSGQEEKRLPYQVSID
jgi:hypothetical protein